MFAPAPCTPFPYHDLAMGDSPLIVPMTDATTSTPPHPPTGTVPRDPPPAPRISRVAAPRHVPALHPHHLSLPPRRERGYKRMRGADLLYNSGATTTAAVVDAMASEDSDTHLAVPTPDADLGADDDDTADGSVPAPRARTDFVSEGRINVRLAFGDRLPELPPPWGATHDYRLSDRLVAYLDRVNPRLNTRNDGALPAAEASMQEFLGPLRWLDAVVVRTRLERGAGGGALAHRYRRRRSHHHHRRHHHQPTPKAATPRDVLMEDASDDGGGGDNGGDGDDEHHDDDADDDVRFTGPSPPTVVGRDRLDDLPFLMGLVYGIGAAALQHADLIVRIEALRNSLVSVDTCLASLKTQRAQWRERALVPTPPDGPRILGNTWNGWMTWAATPVCAPENGAHSDRGGEGPSASDTMSAPQAPSAEPWDAISSYWRDTATERIDRACGHPADELRPLWWLLFIELGYDVGFAGVGTSPQTTMDLACGDRMLVMHPERLPSATATLRRQLATLPVSPAAFLGTIARLGDLGRIKLAAMEWRLGTSAPALASLASAGFWRELAHHAHQCRATRLGAERMQAAMEASNARSENMYFA